MASSNEEDQLRSASNEGPLRTTPAPSRPPSNEDLRRRLVASFLDTDVLAPNVLNRLAHGRIDELARSVHRARLVERQELLQKQREEIKKSQRARAASPTGGLLDAETGENGDAARSGLLLFDAVLGSCLFPSNPELLELDRATLDGFRGSEVERLMMGVDVARHSAEGAEGLGSGGPEAGSSGSTTRTFSSLDELGRLLLDIIVRGSENDT